MGGDPFGSGIPIELEDEDESKPESSKNKKVRDGTTSILWPEGSWSATSSFSTLVTLRSVETVASGRPPLNFKS